MDARLTTELMSTSESDKSPTLSTDAPAGALDGLVVVERAEGIAGPLCGKLLAGFGAEVIKVEHPSGDVFPENWAPSPTMSATPRQAGCSSI